MIKWTISIVPSAMADAYRLPREAAATVTKAIAALGSDPKPQGYESIEDEPDTYMIQVGENVVEYELLEDDKLVRVLVIR